LEGPRPVLRMKLKNKFKENIFHCVKNCGYNPQDFKTEDNDRAYLVSLRSHPDFIFSFGKEDDPNFFSWYYSVFSGDSVNVQPTPYPFDEVLGVFEIWLIRDVKEFLEDERIPDPWETSTAEEELTDENFTTTEIDQINKGLDQLPKVLQSADVPNDKIEILISEIRELRKDLSPNKSKKRWLREFWGTLTQVGSVVIRNPEAQRKLAEWFKELIDVGRTLLN
jgi:hypothetical protein